MVSRNLLILSVLLMLGSAGAHAQDDAAWIEAHLRNGGGTAVGAPPQNRTPDRVSVDNLGKYIGRDVRLHLNSGRVREGLLEKIDGKELFLRTRMGGGYATISFNRGQVVKAELE